jgi:hypothetical protein
VNAKSVAQNPSRKANSFSANQVALVERIIEKRYAYIILVTISEGKREHLRCTGRTCKLLKHFLERYDVRILC